MCAVCAWGLGTSTVVMHRAGDVLQEMEVGAQGGRAAPWKRAKRAPSSSGIQVVSE